MINEVRDETEEEKTFRYLKRYDRRVIDKVLTQFKSKSQSLLFILRQDEIKRLDLELKDAKNEAEYAAIWKERAEYKKNERLPPVYEDGMEAAIWKYGWSLEEYRERR